MEVVTSHHFHPCNSIAGSGVRLQTHCRERRVEGGRGGMTSGAARLGTETVESAAGALEGVDNIEGCHGFPGV